MSKRKSCNTSSSSPRLAVLVLFVALSLMSTPVVTALRGSKRPIGEDPETLIKKRISQGQLGGFAGKDPNMAKKQMMKNPKDWSGEKMVSWPGLRGIDGEISMEIILDDRPDVAVSIILQGSPVSDFEYREDRVRIYVDDEYLVASIPRVG